MIPRSQVYSTNMDWGGGDEATLAPSVVITASVEMDGGTEGGRLHFLRRFVPHWRQSFAPLFLNTCSTRQDCWHLAYQIQTHFRLR